VGGRQGGEMAQTIYAHMNKLKKIMYKKYKTETTRRWWLMPVILAIQVVEIKRIMVQSQPRQIVHETLF
jgi:hypothetical protein